MSDHNLSLVFAFSATLVFSSSSLVYAEYARRVSVLWMNCFKSSVALLLLAATLPIFSGWRPISTSSVVCFFLSGLVGLNIGDLFLLNAFTRLGVARTLILFGFQPLFVGLAAYVLFAQPFNPIRLVAVIFLGACLFTFSFEKFRKEKRWELIGLVHALVGVGLDTCGVLLTRTAFTDSPETTVLQGHLVRCIGALTGFAIINLRRPILLLSEWKKLQNRTRFLLVAASFGGTYLSLILYLSAVRIGHLASIAGIAITGPMFAAVMESVIHRRAPNRYLVFAFTFFCIGFGILWSAA